jgi:hypothetical protein
MPAVLGYEEIVFAVQAAAEAHGLTIPAVERKATRSPLLQPISKPSEYLPTAARLRRHDLNQVCNLFSRQRLLN